MVVALMSLEMVGEILDTTRQQRNLESLSERAYSLTIFAFASALKDMVPSPYLEPRSLCKNPPDQWFR
jgi:hypothetical protein